MENEKKIIPIIIVGAGQEDKLPYHIALYIESHKKSHEIVFVNNIGEIKEKTGFDVDVAKLNTIDLEQIERNKVFERPPIKITKLPELEPLRENFMDMQEHNPWPSPKGRKGKRKW